MNINKRKFRAALELSGMTMDELAQKIGINPATLSRKLNGRSDFYRLEMLSICRVLNIDNPSDIFFSNDVA